MCASKNTIIRKIAKRSDFAKILANLPSVSAIKIAKRLSFAKILANSPSVLAIFQQYPVFLVSLPDLIKAAFILIMRCVCYAKTAEESGHLRCVFKASVVLSVVFSKILHKKVHFEAKMHFSVHCFEKYYTQTCTFIFKGENISHL